MFIYFYIIFSTLCVTISTNIPSKVGHESRKLKSNTKCNNKKCINIFCKYVIMARYLIEFVSCCYKMENAGQ